MLHNGGRLSEELKEVDHKLKIEDEQILIVASYTTGLFNLLKDRVLAITEAAAKLPILRRENEVDGYGSEGRLP
jgi:hypothetical protein